MNNDKFTSILKSIFSVSTLKAFRTFIDLIAGYIIINQLSLIDYASYIICLSSISLVSTISSAGLESSLYTKGAKLWKLQPNEFAELYVSGLAYKKNFTVKILIFLIPYMSWILWKNNFEFESILLSIFSLTPLIFKNIYTSFQNVAMQLAAKQELSHKIEVFFSLIRALSSVCIVVIFPNIPLLIFSSGLIGLCQLIYIRSYLQSNFSLYSAKSSNEKIDSIKKNVNKILPRAIFRSLNQEVKVVLVSIFGTTTMIAGIGALRKISKTFGIINPSFDSIILPLFTKKKYKSKGERLSDLLKILFFKGSIFLLLSVALIYNSDLILRLIGENYSHLTLEFNLIILSLYIKMLNISKYNLSVGYVANSYLIIGIQLIIMLTLIIIIPFNSVLNIVIFGLIKIFSNFIISIIVFFYFNFRT